MDVTVRVWFTGSRVEALALQRMLEAEGVRVTWRPQANLTAVAEQLAMSLMASGTYDAIKAAVGKFRARAPAARAEVDGEPDDGGPDDGGFLG